MIKTKITPQGAIKKVDQNLHYAFIGGGDVSLRY